MDARGARGGLHLLLRGTRAAVGNVVGHGVVEEHGVLRHDTNRLAHAGLRHAANLLPGDGDAALLDVVEAKQQPRQRGLARARGPHHRHRLARRDFKAHALQNGPCRVVGKVHAFKPHRGLRQALQRLRARGIGHLALLVHQHEHLVQVRQALLDLAVDHAEEVEWDVELDHEGVDHHQVTQRHAPIDHALRGAPQHGHQPHGNDELLARVEHGQRGLALEPRAAQALQAFVVAAGLEAFVVEVLHRLVVQQRIHRLGVRGRVELVGFAAELGAPLGHQHGVDDVQHQRGECDPGKPGVKLHGQHAQHQNHFNERGEHIEQRERDQRLDAAHPALDVARHATRLPLQVKAQAQRVQVLKGLQRNRARRPLRGLGKDQLAQLVEHGSGQAQRAVGHQQAHGHDQHGGRIARLEAHGIDQGLEQQGHAHVGQLGGHHEGDGSHHAPLVLPQVGQQALQGQPVGAGSLRGRRRRWGMWRAGFTALAHGGQS